MTTIPTEERRSLTAEHEATVREGLPRVCKAIVNLAAQRCEERGLDGPFGSDISASVSFYDPTIVHSPAYQAAQAEELQKAEAARQDETLSDTDAQSLDEYLEELRAYAALSPDERRGVHRSADLSLEGYGSRVKWARAFSEGAPEDPAGTCLTRIRVDEEGVSFVGSGEKTDLGIVAAAVRVFERAEPEDIRVTASVRL